MSGKWVKSFIVTYPMLFGIVVAIFIFGCIVVCLAWFPAIFDIHDTPSKLGRASIMTIIDFGVYFGAFWRYRRRTAFWPVILTLLPLHVVGVLFFSTKFRPISLSEWSLIGMLEVSGIAMIMAAVAYRRSLHRLLQRRTTETAIK